MAIIDECASKTRNAHHCFFGLIDNKIRLFTLVSVSAGLSDDSLLAGSGGDLSLSLLLHCINKQCLTLVALGSKELSIGKKLGEVHKLLINQHASDATGKVSESLLDDGVDGITNKVLSGINVINRDCVKFSNVDCG